MKLFHGTDPQTATKLNNGCVDITLGGGEFGRGFYMGTSKRLAKRRGYHAAYGISGTANDAMRMRNNTFFIEVDETKYKKFLSSNDLTLTASQRMFGKIKRKKLWNNSIGAHDCIRGFIVGNPRYYCAKQWKFQTVNSQSYLNFHKIPDCFDGHGIV